MELRLFLIPLASLTLSLFQLPEGAQGKNILFFHLLGTSSHRTAIWPLAEQLAERGHNVTYIFPLKKRVGSHPKVEEIIPQNVVDVLMHFLGDFDINFRLNNTVNQFYMETFGKAFEMCELFYDSPDVQEWLGRPGLHYDLVIYDTAMGECVFGLVHKFKAKHILFAPVIPPFIYDGLGFLPETSYIPSNVGFHNKPREMTFFGRVKSTLAPLIWRLGYVNMLTRFESLLQNKLNTTDMPPISEMQKNTSLVLANVHFVEDYALSLPPLFIPTSGLWCSKATRKVPKLLPEKYLKFIEDSEGFIYVSLGSAVVASAMPVEMRNEFLKGFGAFPHLKFLWRWTGPVPENAPKNILFDSWFPQIDVLAHPKIKGFMTQAGRPSTQEALCEAVPLITLPIFGDQDYNSDRLEYIGAAVSLNIDELTSEKIQASIKELTETDKYSKRAKEISSIFKDRPVDPLENAVYWTEFALRHDTQMLVPLGVHQTWWQRRLIDVYAFLILTVILVCGIIIFLGSLLLRFLFRIAIRNGSKHKSD